MYYWLPPVGRMNFVVSCCTPLSFGGKLFSISKSYRHTVPTLHRLTNVPGNEFHKLFNLNFRWLPAFASYETLPLADSQLVAHSLRLSFIPVSGSIVSQVVLFGNISCNLEPYSIYQCLIILARNFTTPSEQIN